MPPTAPLGNGRAPPPIDNNHQDDDKDKTMGAIVGNLKGESMLPPPVPLLVLLPPGTSAASPAAAGGASAASGISTTTRANLYNKEGELELEAAARTTSRKNSYIWKLAERAKMEYATKAGATDSGDGRGFAGFSIKRAAAELLLPTLLSTTAKHQHNAATATAMKESVQWDGGGSLFYNSVCNSFGPAQKWLFLRLLNSGMSLKDTALQICRSAIVPLWTQMAMPQWRTIVIPQMMNLDHQDIWMTRMVDC
jgi:hypothetical protein